MGDVAGNAIDLVNLIGSQGTLQQYSRKFDPGTIIEADNQSNYNAGPMGTSDANNYIEVGQWLLRHRIGIRWHMTEVLISGEAGGAPYAGLLAAESPFVKYAEHQQVVQEGNESDLLWRVLRIAHYMGMFGGISWAEFEAAVDIDITKPEVATRDPLVQTQRYEVLHRNGVVSREHWAQVEGIEPADMGDEPVAPQPLPGGVAQQMAGSVPSALGESIDTLRESWQKFWKGYP